ncbi:Polymerase/histidinol phosphatase-like protein, partial [Coemansia spiralis]
MPFTFHSHSGQFCRHAKGCLEDVVKSAIAKNMVIIGLSEHVPRSRTKDLYPEESDMTTDDLHTAFQGYVAEARRLREKYTGQIEILIGAETEYITDDTLAELKQLREQYALDYLVGSIHHVSGMPMDFSQESYDQIVQHFGGDRKQMFCRYFDEQLVLLQRLKPEIIGHFDLIRIFHPYDQGVEDPLALAEIRDLASRNIDYAISYGAVFEVNSRAWKKGLRDAYPQRDLLEEILSKGGRITISDDSHGAQDVGMYYDRLLAYLNEMGAHDLHYLHRAE